MSYNYVVTAHRPTKVTHSCVGNFLGGSERNLLVAKITFIEVHSIKFEGLVPALDLPIYGRIIILRLFRPPGDSQDNLLVLTDKNKLVVLRWDAATAQCITVLSCDVSDHLGRPLTGPPFCVVDPTSRCIALHRFDHLLKIIPISGSAGSSAFNVRLQEDEVLDLVFLNGCKRPTLAILYRDEDDGAHVRTYEVFLAEQDLSAEPWSRSNLDGPVWRLIPMPAPYGGVIMIAEQWISYTNGSDLYITRQIDPMLIRCYGQVDLDGSRFLLGDQQGKLMMLVLDLDRETAEVQALQVEQLGETSSAATVSYLDKGFVYIGSDFGDSQLIRLNTKQNPETNSYVEIIQLFTGLGPITDFCVVQGVGYLRQGQGQLVTCSGAYKDGSLRVIRNGIGITEQASVALPGIKDMWSLRRHFGDQYHMYLVQSFATQTRVYEVIGVEDMAPATLPSVDEEATTLYMGNVAGDMIVQVTADGIRVLDCASMTGARVPAWKPPGESRVLLATGNSLQLLLATTGGTLVYFEVDPAGKAIKEVKQVVLETEVACLNCNPLGPETEYGGSAEIVAKVAAVGLWADVNQPPAIVLLSLPTLARLQTVHLEGDVMARSVLLATLEQHDYLLVALGDGHLLSYAYLPTHRSEAVNAVSKAAASEDGTAPGDSDTVDSQGSILRDKRRLSTGTHPASLNLFRSKGANHVFAASDRPTVVYAERGGGKLLVSNVNWEQVTRVCWFDTEAFPDCLAIATEECLHLGAVDDIQKLHIQTFPLGRQARRIAHVVSARCFAVLTESSKIDENGDEEAECVLQLFDDTVFGSLDSCNLQEREVGVSIMVASFPGMQTESSSEYIVIGTGYESPNEPESNLGRIIVFAVVNNRLVQMVDYTTRGVVYSLVTYDNGILAGVNAVIQSFSLSMNRNGTLQIKKEISYKGNTLVCKLRSQGDFILAGDLMQSVALLSRKSVNDPMLVQLGRDYEPAWTSALDFVDDSSFILAENSKNLMLLQRNLSSSRDLDRMYLNRVGVFHLGLQINRIQQGSIVMEMPDDGETPVTKTMVFVTGEGMIGVIATLRPHAFQFFLQFERAMQAHLPGVGELSHASWREFISETPSRVAPARGFLDGDLIESFLDLPPSHAAKVASAVGVTIEELTRRVEEIQRLTH